MSCHHFPPSLWNIFGFLSPMQFLLFTADLMNSSIIIFLYQIHCCESFRIKRELKAESGRLPHRLKVTANNRLPFIVFAMMMHPNYHIMVMISTMIGNDAWHTVRFGAKPSIIAKKAIGAIFVHLSFFLTTSVPN